MPILTADPIPSPQLREWEKSLEIYEHNKQKLYLLIKLRAGIFKNFHSPVDYKNFVFSQFSGSRIWYLLLHPSNDVENSLGCFDITVEPPVGSRSIISVNVYNKMCV